MSLSQMNPVGFSSLQAPGSLSILRVVMPSQVPVPVVNSAAPKFRGGQLAVAISLGAFVRGMEEMEGWRVSHLEEQQKILCEDHMFPGRKFPCRLCCDLREAWQGIPRLHSFGIEENQTSRQLQKVSEGSAGHRKMRKETTKIHTGCDEKTNISKSSQIVFYFISPLFPLL